MDFTFVKRLQRLKVVGVVPCVISLSTPVHSQEDSEILIVRVGHLKRRKNTKPSESIRYKMNTRNLTV